MTVLHVPYSFVISASERGGSNGKRFKDFHPKMVQAKAAIWRRLSYMRHIRPAAVKTTDLGIFDQAHNLDILELEDTDEFISDERRSPFGWIEPEIAKYPEST